MKAIAYLMFGDRREYKLELTYSVLSAAHFLRREAADIQIVLVTTESGRRDDLPVQHIIIDDAEMERWMLGGKYTHAAKYEALLRVMDAYNDKVLYVDTDTYFTEHPLKLFERIGPGQTLMHDNDMPLGAHSYWTSLLAKVDGPIAGYPVKADSKMFNAGVLGVDWSMRTRIEDVYDLMSSLFSIEPVFNVEQYAFSAVLSRNNTLSICPDVVKHYWGYERRFVVAQIGDMFPEFSKDLFEHHVGSLRHLGIPPKPLINRVRARVLRLLRGGNKQYSFAFLSYLCALSSKSAMMADVWANTALDAIVSETVVWNDGDLAHMRWDFCQFLPEHLDAHSWLSPATRGRWRQYWSQYQQ